MGFEREGWTTVEGEAVDKINGLSGVRAEMMWGGSRSWRSSSDTRRLRCGFTNIAISTRRGSFGVSNRTGRLHDRAVRAAGVSGGAEGPTRHDHSRNSRHVPHEEAAVRVEATRAGERPGSRPTPIPAGAGRGRAVGPAQPQHLLGRGSIRRSGPGCVV